MRRLPFGPTTAQTGHRVFETGMMLGFSSHRGPLPASFDMNDSMTARADHPHPQTDALIQGQAAPVAAELPDRHGSEQAKTGSQAGSPRPNRPTGKGRKPAQGRADAPGANRRPAPPQHPVLAQLATLYPALFGTKPLPLKRGILQDLLAAHPDALAKDGLKEALAQYTRSTRYLTAMASGQARHDLNGTAVEAVAPEHQHHALLEVFKRRHARTGEDVRGELRSRMLLAAEQSGLAPADYALRVRNKDEAANAILDDAMADLASRVAREQALLQAFEGSGKTVNEFAGMYGLHPIEAAATLNRARARLATAAAVAAVANETAAGADAPGTTANDSAAAATDTGSEAAA